MRINPDAIDRENDFSYVEGLPLSLATTFDPECWEHVEWGDGRVPGHASSAVATARERGSWIWARIAGSSE